MWELSLIHISLRLKDENGAALQVNVGKSYVAIVGKDREGCLLYTSGIYRTCSAIST